MSRKHGGRREIISGEDMNVNEFELEAIQEKARTGFGSLEHAFAALESQQGTEAGSQGDSWEDKKSTSNKPAPKLKRVVRNTSSKEKRSDIADATGTPESDADLAKDGDQGHQPLNRPRIIPVSREERERRKQERLQGAAEFTALIEENLNRDDEAESEEPEPTLPNTTESPASETSDAGTEADTGDTETAAEVEDEGNEDQPSILRAESKEQTSNRISYPAFNARLNRITTIKELDESSAAFFDKPRVVYMPGKDELLTNEELREMYGNRRFEIARTKFNNADSGKHNQPKRRQVVRPTAVQHTSSVEAPATEQQESFRVLLDSDMIAQTRNFDELRELLLRSRGMKDKTGPQLWNKVSLVVDGYEKPETLTRTNDLREHVIALMEAEGRKIKGRETKEKQDQVDHPDENEAELVSADQPSAKPNEELVGKKKGTKYRVTDLQQFAPVTKTASFMQEDKPGEYEPTVFKVTNVPETPAVQTPEHQKPEDNVFDELYKLMGLQREGSRSPVLPENKPGLSSAPIIDVEAKFIPHNEKVPLDVASIAETRSVQELKELLFKSTGITDSTTGYYSGEGLAYLVSEVDEGRAYIEEIPREFYLREHLYDLLKRDNRVFEHDVSSEKDAEAKFQQEVNAAKGGWRSFFRWMKKPWKK